jgi:DNA polymerase-3 subunit epsilon
MSTIAVIDFETTGMSPSMGSRATEVAAVLVEDGRIVGRFQSLMNSGAWIPPFIEQLTGISNAMLADAPPARAVMHEVMRFTRGVPLVAHNAAFDRGFWAAEAARADCEADPAHRFACTMLLSRRLYPEAPNHRLGTLADWHGLPKNGRAHRALADAEVTAHLLLRLQADLRERHAALLEDCGGAPDHDALCAVQRLSRREIARRRESVSAAAASTR